MELNTTQDFDFLGAYQTCLKAIETDEFTGSICIYYAEIMEALRIAMKHKNRPKGEWIKESDYNVMGEGFLWKCSECGQRTYVDSVGVFPNFCERCGADMRGEE